METKQTLEQFIQQQRKYLDEFEQSWIKNNRQRPEQFPDKLEEGIWWEMLQTFNMEM